MKTLIIDNYDSFTFNLFQMVSEANGTEAIVVRNNSFSWDELQTLDFDNIIISPGPGHPGRAGDFGVCADIIARYKGPLLAVCLGHQGLCRHYGSSIIGAPEVMHGRLSKISHSGTPLFRGIPSHFTVTRYHSLIVESLPAEFIESARTADGIIMAVEHRELPHYGLQFHPESICTDYGMTLLENFRDISRSFLAGRQPKRGLTSLQGVHIDSVIPRGQKKSDSSSPFRVQCRKLEHAPLPELIFTELYKDDPQAIWLDSSKRDNLKEPCSVIGGSGGPHFFRVEYSVAAEELTIIDKNKRVTRKTSIFDYLKEELERLKTLENPTPFSFNCGFAGYLGYELNSLTLGIKNRFYSTEPDASLLFLDRIMIYDHSKGDLYLVALEKVGEESAAGWFDLVEESLKGLEETTLERAKSKLEKASTQPQFSLSRDKERYVEDIEHCLQYIREGESYELCLTNKLRCNTDISPLLYHLNLREINPAPYAVYYRSEDIAIASSSIERFLHIDSRGAVETKPIKGTIARGETEAADRALKESLESSLKDRAENLMIVDLLRNDLGIVCEIGSVTVPHLMKIESYATVHQMVSTVRGRLKEGLSPVDCIEQTFPGGSMTGAPKRRTIELLERLEGEARGVYSGAIGYMALNGAVDLNIVMRTAIFNKGSYKAGIGGAIVALSEPEAEFAEILLKGKALMRSFS